MSNYLVTYLPTDPPTHHTYLPPYFLTYLPTYSFFSSLSCFSYVLPLVTVWSFSSLPAPPLNKTLDGGHAAPLSQSQNVQSPILQQSTGDLTQQRGKVCAPWVGAIRGMKKCPGGITDITAGRSLRES